MGFGNKRVLIMGLGLLGGGLGSALYFARRNAFVTVTDLKEKKALTASLKKLRAHRIRYVLGRHDKKDFYHKDLIVKNPAVSNSSPFLKIALKNKIPVETEASIFLKSAGAFVFGVTGTKGKTTTANLIYRSLKVLGFNVELTGVPTTSFLETLDKTKQKNGPKIIVAEFSSWDLESIKPHKISPPIAVITNISPDHLNRHKDMANYAKAKSFIFRFQTKKDCVIYPKKDAKFWKKVAAKSQRVLVGQNDVLKISKLKIAGNHNRENAALAFAAIKAGVNHSKFPLKTVPKNYQSKVMEAIQNFSGLSGHMETVRTYKSRLFVNDTASTNPISTIAAIKTIGRPLILILGGEDKKLNYKKMAGVINYRVKYAILFKGSASDKIIREFSKIKFRNFTKNVSTMDAAVKIALLKSRKGDAILFSPSAASFNLFKNEFDRGSKFVKAVKQIK